jgi:ADP-ribosylglycohydrolase
LVAQEQGQTHVEAAISRGETLDLAKLADRGPKSAGSDITTGYVLNGLTLAVAALLDPRSFKDVLVDVVRLGGDADTNGAIAGGALGARDGKEKIPESWLETLQFGDEFEEKTKWLLSE